MKKVVSSNFQLTAPIESVIFKQFRKLNSNVTLGLVSRILEVDEFLVLEDKNNAIVTRMDFLNFVGSNQLKAVSNDNVHTN